MSESSHPSDRLSPIGGFLEIELPGTGAARSLRAHWNLLGPQRAFSNARSAFKALLYALPRGSVFLPAYLCPEMSAVVTAARRRFYPVDETLSPALPYLEERVAAGDIVLAVDYFGRTPASGFLDFVASHPNVWFVEDCAQSFAGPGNAWGDWQVYSPRKLVGIPDGGLLAARTERAKTIGLAEPVPVDFARAADLAHAQWLRYHDSEGRHNERWYPLHRAKEESLGVSAEGITRLAWDLLGLLDVDAIAAARRRNYGVLAHQLADVALFGVLPEDCIPSGFPVRVPARGRDAIRERLFRERIFPAVHWEALLAPADEFPLEHRLASCELTLPCDQRYSIEQMRRVADRFRDALA